MIGKTTHLREALKAGRIISWQPDEESRKLYLTCNDTDERVSKRPFNALKERGEIKVLGYDIAGFEHSYAYQEPLADKAPEEVLD